MFDFDLKKMVEGLKVKFRHRIQRAEVLVDGLYLTEAEVDQISREEYSRLMEMDKAALIREFVDPEEMVIRGILRKI